LIQTFNQSGGDSHDDQDMQDEDTLLGQHLSEGAIANMSVSNIPSKENTPTGGWHPRSISSTLEDTYSSSPIPASPRLMEQPTAHFTTPNILGDSVRDKILAGLILCQWCIWANVFCSNTLLINILIIWIRNILN
jgi:hypothetical protein